MTKDGSELDSPSDQADTIRNRRAADEAVGGTDMSSAAIEQAQAELRSTRGQLSQARKAIRALLRPKSSRSAAEVIRDVAAKEDLDTTTVQRAIWTLVHDGNVELTENYELRLR